MPSSALVSVERYVREVERWVQALARDIEAPALDVTGRFTHQTQDAQLAAYLKAVRLASTLNAALLLLRAGHVLEVGALCRMIDEACQDIAFLLIPPGAGSPTSDQQRFVVEFYREHFPDPANLTPLPPGPKQLPRKAVHKAIVRQLAADGATDGRVEAFQVIHRATSGFVHAAYRNIMDLYGGEQPRYHTSGMLGTPRMEGYEHTMVSCVCRSLLEVERLALAMNRRDVASRVLVQAIRLARRTGCLSPAGIERAIRRLQSL